jgi:hypothetical protein
MGPGGLRIGLRIEGKGVTCGGDIHGEKEKDGKGGKAASCKVYESAQSTGDQHGQATISESVG